MYCSGTFVLVRITIRPCAGTARKFVDESCLGGFLLSIWGGLAAFFPELEIVQTVRGGSGITTYLGDALTCVRATLGRSGLAIP